MNTDVPSCHGVSGDLVSCSGDTLTPAKVHRLLWYLGKYGWRSTAARVITRVAAFVGAGHRNGTAASASPVSVSEEVLNLQAGDWVEVRAEPEIRRTLDANGRYKGLLWMENMSRFCGRRFRVRKRLERIMLESDGQMRRLKNTVLLEGVMCEDLYGCDRSCFHFWREAWLRRVVGDRQGKSGDSE